MDGIKEYIKDNKGTLIGFGVAVKLMLLLCLLEKCQEPKDESPERYQKMIQIDSNSE